MLIYAERCASALRAYPEAAPNAAKDVLGKGQVGWVARSSSTFLPAGGWRYAGGMGSGGPGRRASNMKRSLIQRYLPRLMLQGVRLGGWVWPAEGEGQACTVTAICSNLALLAGQISI